MTNPTATVPTVAITGSTGAAEAEILTPQALEFLGALSANFEAERQRLLAARVTRGEALRKGQLYDFLPETPIHGNGRNTLFFDGLHPMYSRPVRRLKCGPNV